VSAQPSLFDLIQRRLAEHYASTQPRNVGYPTAVKNAILGGINLPFEAGGHIGGDITGSLYAMSAQDTRATSPLDARIAAAYDQGGPAAAFEAAKTDPRKEVSLTAGALGMLTDPTLLVGGPLGKLGKVGEIADTVLSTPFRPLEVALGQVGRRAVGPAIQRAREALYGATESVAGNVPKSAGLIGPVPPPPLRAPPPLVPGPTSILDLARGGVPPAEVARVAPLPEALAPTRAPNLVREATAGVPKPALHGPVVPEGALPAAMPAAARTGKWTPEQLATFEADPDVQRVMADVERARTGMSGTIDKESLTGGASSPRGRRLKALGFELAAARKAALARAETARALAEVGGAPEAAAAAGVDLAPASIAPQEAAQAATGALPEAAPLTREAGLAALSGHDTNTLLSVAYDHPRAVANAQRKYGDVGALRTRAIERIQADRGRVARLAEADPDLAARVAALPDVEAAVPVTKAAPESAREIVQPAPAPGTLTAAQDAAVTKLLGYHPNVTGDPRMWDALRQTAIDRGIPAEAIDRAAATVPITSGEGEQFMGDPALIRDRIAELEASPEGQLFKYINPGGKFKLVDTRSGTRIAVREGGAFREAIESPWNIPGTHYDEVAQAALSSRLSPEAVDRTDLDTFFERARQLWRERQYLRAQLRGEATGAGMMVVTPLAAARTLGPDVARGADKALEALTGVTGADVATYGPESLAYYKAQRQAEAQGVRTEAQAREAGLPAYVRGSKGPGEFLGDFIRFVRDQVVVTPKNQILDKQHTRFMVGEFAPEGEDIGGTIAQIAADKRAARAAPVAAKVGSFLDGVMGPEASARYQQGLDLGEGLVGSLDEAGQALGTPRRELPAMQRRIFGVLTAALRTRGPVSAASIPVGALRGELAPLINEFFRTVNRFPQRIGREALFYLTAKGNALEASGQLLDRMAAEGVDVAPLTGRLFSPADVETVAGPEWAHAWSSALATTLGAAEAETKRVLGSFTEKTALEKLPGIGKVFWLMGWSQRMLPVYAQVAARHPGVAMAVGGATLEQARHLREQGLPPWAAGGIDTAIGRVDLLSPMPFSGELAGEALSALGEGDPGETKTPYQTAEGIAGGLGLPVNPIVGTAAYVAGLTPKRPGDFDRWAGPINALPGPTTGLDYGHLVDKAREIVTGLAAGDLAVGKKAPASETDKEWNRLVAERTGLVASDPRNIGAIIDVQTRETDPDTLAARWYREAEQNVKARQGKQGVVSAVSPLTISRIDPLQRAAAIWRQNQPYTYEQISAAYDAGQKKQAQRMQRANDASKAPGQRVYDSASEAQRTALVKRWLDAATSPSRVPLETNTYGLRRTGGGADLSGLRRR
jgi:hypothetical protein